MTQRASIQFPPIVPNGFARILPPNPERRYLMVSHSGTTAFYVFFGDPQPAAAINSPGIRIASGQSPVEFTAENIGGLIQQAVWINWPSATASNVTVIEGFD